MEINNSNGRIIGILNKSDLQTFLEKRQSGERVIAGILSLEGAHALEGNLQNLDTLYKNGVRIFGLAHLFDNDIAGSTHGKKRYGLTEKGVKAIRNAQRLHMIIDLAHASEKTIDDVVSISEKPVIYSHGGVRGTLNSIRNLKDEQIQAIASTGGVIGISFFKRAVGGNSIVDAVKAIRYVADLVGYQYVAIGSDFDGAVVTSINSGGFSLLTGALLDAGFNRNEIRAIMGGNAIRVFMETLSD